MLHKPTFLIRKHLRYYVSKIVYDGTLTTTIVKYNLSFWLFLVNTYRYDRNPFELFCRVSNYLLIAPIANFFLPKMQRFKEMEHGVSFS